MTDKIDNAFDMRCPKCGTSDEIDIAATVWIRLCPDGTDVTQAAKGDHEWEHGSLAACDSCGHAATVRDFEASNQTTVNDNEACAKRAAEAVYQYVKAKGVVYEESSSEVVDLITDLLHLAVKLDQGDDPLDSTLSLARMHFDAEQDEGGKS